MSSGLFRLNAQQHLLLIAIYPNCAGVYNVQGALGISCASRRLPEIEIDMFDPRWRTHEISGLIPNTAFALKPGPTPAY